MKTLDVRWDVGIDVLDRLGAAMYSSPEQAISEFVANAYDADAEHVAISIKGDRITVEDDGTGMNEEGVGSYFGIARSAKRASGETTEGKGRAKIGSKGVGRLAAFYLGSRFRVETTAGGSKTTFEVDRAKLDPTRSLSEQRQVCRVDRGRGHGTVLEIGSIREHIKENGVNISRLREHLSRTMPRQPDFTIHVNGVLCTVADIPARRTVVVDLRLPHLGRVKGTIIVARRELDRPGVSVTVRGRVVGKPSFFGFVTRSKKDVEHHISGTVEAAGLDPVILTSREGFDEGSREYVEFARAMAEEIGVVVREEEALIRKKEQAASSKRVKDMLKGVTRALAKAFAPSALPDQPAENGERQGTEGDELPPAKKEEAERTETETPRDQDKEPRKNPTPPEKKPETARSPGKISIGGRDYHLDTAALGVDEPECVLRAEQGVIILNIDHPSWQVATEIRDSVPFVCRMVIDLVALTHAGSVDEARLKIDEACRTIRPVGGEFVARRVPITGKNAPEAQEKESAPFEDFRGKGGPFLKRAAKLKIGAQLVVEDRDWKMRNTPAHILTVYTHQRKETILFGRRFSSRRIREQKLCIITRTR